MHRIGVSAGNLAVLVENTTGIVIDRMWLHELNWIGVFVYAPQQGETGAATVTGSLIEGAVAHGVYALGGDVSVIDSVVRDTQPNGTTNGEGIYAQYEEDTQVASTLAVSGSLVERNSWAGIRIRGGDGVISDTLVRHVSNAASGAFGAGIHVAEEDSPVRPSSVTITGVVVDDTRQCAICVYDSDAVIERATLTNTSLAAMTFSGAGVLIANDGDIDHFPSLQLRETLVANAVNFGVGVLGAAAVIEGVAVRDVVREGDQASAFGVGVSIELSPLSGDRSSATVHGVTVDRTMAVGMSVGGSDADIESVAIRNVASSFEGLFGRGFTFDPEPTSLASSDVELRHASVHGVHEAGIAVLGSHAIIESVTISDVSTTPLDQLGVGIIAQMSIETGARTSIDLRWATVEQTKLVGILVAGADAVVANTRVQDVTPAPGNDVADGIAATALVSTLAFEVSVVSLEDSWIESAQRAGVSSFAATIDLAGSWMMCNTIAINGEIFDGTAFSYDDLGGNVCGCGAAREVCKVLSSNLTPPPALTAP